MQNFHDGLLIPPPGEDKEHEATTDTELTSTEDIQPLPVQKPPRESDMCQLIEECCIEVSEKQKKSMEDTMIELVKICQEKEFLCIHNDVDDLIESTLDSKLLLINSNSQRLDKKEHEVKNIIEQPTERGNRSIQSLPNFKVVHKSSISSNTSQISLIYAIAPVLSTKEPEHLLSIGYEHLSITPETEPDEVTESNAENLLPIPSECEVALEDKRECGVPISENSLVCDNHSDTFFDSKIDDDISDYDDDFEDIEYIEASLFDPEIVSIEEENSVKAENVVQQEEEEVNFEDISQIQDVVLREKLLSITQTRSGNTTHVDYSLLEYDSFCFEIEPDQERLIYLVKNDIPADSSNDPHLEEVDLFLSDDSIQPGIENIVDDPERDIRFLEELLIDNFILSHELSDNPSIPRPPPEPPDVKTNAEEEIPVVMNEKDEDVYSSFIFVIYPEMFPLLLSAESEDTIFDPEPPQNSDIRQLIREECCVEVPEKQKQKMEDTMLELVKFCQEKEFLCIHDDVDDLIESALNSKLLLINSNSQHLDKKEQEVKNVVEQPAERGNCSIQSLQNFKECGVPISENSPVCDNHSDTFSDSKIDDDISDYDDDFEDIEYVEASLFNPEIERLINLVKNDIPDNSMNDPLLEEVDLFLSDNSIPPGEEIPVVMNDKDEFDNDDYSSFMFVIFAKEFSLLSAESEDTIFDPGFPRE
nr:hypothetical protein [Tanacetum cinerariifolium]